METVKSFTDISQSKTLSKILPLESADMWWPWYSDPVFNNGHYDDFPMFCKPVCNPDESVPCWSLTSLLDVLSYCPDLSKHTDGKWYITTYPNNLHTCLMAYDNPVDACYEMIMHLHEQKIL